MNNQLEAYPSVTNEIVDNASRFTEFLSSDTLEPVRKKITIIPNIVKDILDVALDNKKLKIQDNQFRKKAKLAQHYLECQDKDAQRKYHIELEKIHAQTDTIIAELEQKRNIKLSHIESTRQTQLQKIQSDESIELTKIQYKYELARQKQINEKKMFEKVLRESNKRYERQMKNVERVQSELSVLIKAIANKMMNGTVSDYECKLLEHFSNLKIQTLDKSFDISEGLLKMFAGGE
ncbi:hypothetical protein [Ruminococcus sp. Marseille-P6503]|uniref:hypothetical protein n=1 Tax=Ruminococcus sp. Marseille-P6503 TaxID=2364796 RepID=UPI000F531D53|nr:hypothetical protein [Ruminococcus sp. Marseille-P6503]